MEKTHHRTLGLSSSFAAASDDATTARGGGPRGATPLRVDSSEERSMTRGSEQEEEKEEQSIRFFRQSKIKSKGKNFLSISLSHSFFLLVNQCCERSRAAALPTSPESSRSSQ
jgi:hypothetical protein